MTIKDDYNANDIKTFNNRNVMLRTLPSPLPPQNLAPLYAQYLGRQVGVAQGAVREPDTFHDRIESALRNVFG